MSETPPLVDHTHEHNDATTALVQISGTAARHGRACLRKHKQQGPYLRRRSRIWSLVGDGLRQRKQRCLSR